ncbi:MAG: preprotein translocase subunit SecG [Alphaproteobacteria bacterium]|nr:preprotein translocase subunit SecG [Alphaproteobacteria bacterium]
MTATLLVIHILLAIALIAVILVQRTTSDGGGLMGGSGGSSMGGMLSVRGTANLLTRVTGILATAFIATSILLTILAGSHNRARSITDQIKPAAVEQKAQEQPAAGTTDKPAQSTPAVPLSQ